MIFYFQTRILAIKQTFKCQKFRFNVYVHMGIAIFRNRMLKARPVDPVTHLALFLMEKSLEKRKRMKPVMEEPLSENTKKYFEEI